MSQGSAVNVNSVVDLRNATDEKLPLVLSNLGYKQSFALVDTRLAIGYLSVASAALTFLLERKYKFNEAYNYTAILVLTYAILSGIGWIHSTFIEKDIIYKGQKGDQYIEISGRIDKFVAEYPLTLKINTKGQKPVNIKKILEFKDIFDHFGNLHEAQLESWIKKELTTHSKDK